MSTIRVYAKGFPRKSRKLLTGATHGGERGTFAYWEVILVDPKKCDTLHWISNGRYGENTRAVYGKITTGKNRVTVSEYVLMTVHFENRTYSQKDVKKIIRGYLWRPIEINKRRRKKSESIPLPSLLPRRSKNDSCTETTEALV
jgi:hypothetical protein